jgi:AraC-like DNA-binding protein
MNCLVRTRGLDNRVDCLHYIVAEMFILAEAMFEISTSHVPARDRVAFWVDAVCDVFACSDCEPARASDFFGEIRSDTLGDVQVATVTSTAQTMTRSTGPIAKGPADTFFVNVQTCGREFGSQDGRDVELRPGDLALYDGTRPYRLAFEENFSQTVLQIPRTAVRRRLGEACGLTAVRIDGTTGLGALISPLLRELPRRLDAIPAASRARVGENFLDLIATAFLAEAERTPSSPAMTLVRVKFWIETHLSEDLSAERIAGPCNVSVRHLNRLFARDGTSAMCWVWRRRLALCHRMLVDPAARARSISEIAFAAGYNDLSHFSRTYRARYGCTPRDARRRSVSADTK